MKLSFMVLFTFLQCVFLSPFQIIGNPLEQKTAKQIAPGYHLKKPFYYYYNENSDLYLTLYDEFKYELRISKRLSFREEFIANFVENTISFGHFTINRDKSYTFRDIPTGIEFRAYKTGDSLKLAEKIMMKGYMEAESDDDIDQRYYLKELAKIQKIELRDSCPDVNCGVYLSNLDSLVMLNLKHDNAYELQVFDVPLSSGRWRQHNAEIILSDSCLNKEMKLIVDNDHLIGSFMPGNLIGTKLYLKEPVKTLSSNQPTSGNRNRAWWISIGLIVLFSLGSWIAICRKCKTKQTTHHSNNVV